jgi:hypothetical protein
MSAAQRAVERPGDRVRLGDITRLPADPREPCVRRHAAVDLNVGFHLSLAGVR